MVTNRKSKGIIFLVVGIVVTVVGLFILMDAMNNAHTRPTNTQGKISTNIIAIGILSLLVGIILIVKAIEQKKLGSMSQSDLVEVFNCNGSGNKSAVYLIKLAKDKIVVKQSCPPSGTRRFTIPLRLTDQCIPYFQDMVFRCFKCGQEATVDHVNLSGTWTLLKMSCPTHGNELTYHKIWSTIYKEIAK